MANYNNIKATIDGNIFENGSELITGSILNDVLNQMVDAFAVGYQYKGVATPSLNPGSPDARVFYLTTTPGIYTRFGGLTVGSGELALLRWDSSWHKDSFSVGGGGGGGDVNVIDNLYSSSPIDALSANQGRILNGKIAELVLKVDSSNLIAEFASSFAELSEQYPLIYVDGHTKILPVSGESTGWLFETPSGWRIVTSDLDSEFGSVSSFEEVLSGIASISVPLRMEVIDNLTSTSATAALSAKQGGVLKDRIDSRVLVVDASEKISDHVSDVKGLGIYPHINVAGQGDILPIYESTVGWLYEYQEGWRIAGDIANFDINKTFDELMARLDEISSPIYTKPSSGIPESDLATAVKNKLALIDRKADKMTVSTANPDDEEVTIQPNEFCVMVGEPNTAFYVIYFLENTTHMESIFKFTTGDDVPTIEWDGITAWLGGEPTINANKTYIVSVLDGLGVIGEF